MKKIVLMLCIAALAGCEGYKEPQPDQKLRAELFYKCLAAIPKGPERVGTSNDWDEVVGECGSQAYYLSLRGGSRNLQ